MKILLRAALVLLTTLPAQAGVPTPESLLGFHLGEDRKLADWTQLVAYYKALGASSERVRVEEVGRTTEDNPFLVVTISSEANLKHLEEIRQTNQRLFDPRGLSEEEGARLVEKGRTIVALNHGIHSDEVAASQTAAETAYWLATSDSPEVKEILDQTVVVLLPSHNPDGTQKVTEWYRRTLGTPYEGVDTPFLYQKYTGHDNNRDWYMFTQRETRLTVEHLYDKWHPQIVHDLHQMGPRTARMFVPPYLDPWEPNVDPALRAAVNGLGAHLAAQLTAEGKTGVVIHALYDAWTPARAYPHTHGGVRILSEVAEARMATPRETPFDELVSGIG
ncbi:MAG: M14 family metallopeptidase [bacterium]